MVFLNLSFLDILVLTNDLLLLVMRDSNMQIKVIDLRWPTFYNSFQGLSVVFDLYFLIMENKI